MNADRQEDIQMDSDEEVQLSQRRLENTSLRR